MSLVGQQNLSGAVNRQSTSLSSPSAESRPDGSCEVKIISSLFARPHLTNCTRQSVLTGHLRALFPVAW